MKGWSEGSSSWGGGAIVRGPHRRFRLGCSWWLMSPCTSLPEAQRFRPCSMHRQATAVRQGECVCASACPARLSLSGVGLTRLPHTGEQLGHTAQQDTLLTRTLVSSTRVAAAVRLWLCCMPHLAVSHGAVGLQDGAAAAAAWARVCAHLLTAAPDEGRGLWQRGAAAQVVQEVLQVVLSLRPDTSTAASRRAASGEAASAATTAPPPAHHVLDMLLRFVELGAHGPCSCCCSPGSRRSARG